MLAYTSTEAGLEYRKVNGEVRKMIEGSRGRVDSGAVQEHREENNVKKQQGGLQVMQYPKSWPTSNAIP